MPRQTDKPQRRHVLHIDDETWDAMGAEAARAGATISAVIRAGFAVLAALPAESRDAAIADAVA